MKKKLIQGVTTGGHNFSIDLRNVVSIFPITYGLFTAITTERGEHFTLAMPMRDVVRQLPEKALRWNATSQAYEVANV